MLYRLLIIFSASSAEIGENRLKTFPSLSITSSNMVLGLTHTPRSPYMACYTTISSRVSECFAM